MQNNIYKIVATNIKKYRKKQNLTQSELAELSGYSHEFIRSIEAPNTKKSFSLQTVYEISRALGIDINFLFEVVN